MLELFVLWVHIVAVIIFVGGSLFMWMVMVPASYEVTNDEVQRTITLGKVAKRFAKVVNLSLILILASGLYNATWYLPSLSALVTTNTGRILLTKSLLVAVLLTLVYFNGIYYGRRIMKLAREKNLEELKRIRRVTNSLSYVNLALMLVVVLLAAMLRMPL